MNAARSESRPASGASASTARRSSLTAREFDLLLHFARHPGQVFNRARLLDQVWGYNHEGYEHTVNSHINRLRAKIERDPSTPRYILTVWGVGYKFSDRLGVDRGTATDGGAPRGRHLRSNPAHRP